MGRAEVRAECGPGGGCWAGPAAFLSLSLRLLAPARAVTTVWLNAADQVPLACRVPSWLST